MLDQFSDYGRFEYVYTNRFGVRLCFECATTELNPRRELNHSATYCERCDRLIDTPTEVESC